MSSAADLEASFPKESVSSTSRKQYVRQLVKWLSISSATTIDDVVKNPVEMFKILDKKTFSDHAKKLMIASVCSLLRHSSAYSGKYCEYKEIWSAKLRKMNEVQFDRMSTMEATPREIANWVDWDDVLKRERELAKYEFGSDRHLILAMYSLIDPVRADYGDVRVAIDKHVAKRYDDNKYNHVYLTSKPGKSFLVLHVYKTSKAYGRFARYIPDELARIIAKNMENDPREWLIVDTRGHPYEKRNSFTKYVNRVLEELFEKKFTIRLLRHSRISSVDYNESTPKELFRLSKNMQHSTVMQQLYRRKIPQPETSTVDDAPATRQQPTLLTDKARISEEKTKKKKKKKKKKMSNLLQSLSQFEPGADRTIII